MEIWLIIIALIVTPLAIVGWYFLTSHKRKIAQFGEGEKIWKRYAPTDMEVVRYSLFLIGDAGAPSLKSPEGTLVLLRKKIVSAGKNSAVFFLGDNIYPTGMPSPNDTRHEQAEKRLLRQLETLEGYEGRIGFISGNHDWNKGRRGGYESVRRQQFYIEAYFRRQDVYLPRNGCPGPVEIEINSKLVFIVINTQWWVHSGTRPLGKINGCTVDSEHEFFQALEGMLERHREKQIVVIGHHPMYSRAYHGGNFSVKQHLFPLTELNKRLYVPLPIAGSIYPMYRKYIGSKEDMSHPKYKNMRKRLIDIFDNYDNLIYAAGHDHNLQYIKKDKQHYLVSGAGCKVNHVQAGDGAKFTHAHKGFMRLDFYYNGDVWLEVWEPHHHGEEGELVYRKMIIEGNSF